MSPIDEMKRLTELMLSFVVGIILLVFFLRRLLAWMDRRGWIMYSGDPPTYGTLGNAFQQLQSVAQPEVDYILEEKQAERYEEDDAGGPDDPTRHLRRELRRREESPRDN